MSRYPSTLIALLAFATLSMSGTALASANPIALEDDDQFGWAILDRDGATQSFGIRAGETLRKIKGQYGPELLVIVDRDQRYVITDAGLIQDALRESRKIRDMEPDIAELAQAQAKLTMAELNRHPGERLERRERELEKALGDAERNGEVDEELRQELFEARVALQVSESMERQTRLTADERRDFARQRDKAAERVNRGMSKIRAEIREILQRAKSRGLARLLD